MKRRTIQAIFDSQTVEIELFDDLAPKTCQKIWESLPVQGVLNHVKIAGDEVMVKIPYFVDELENPVIPQEAGNVCTFEPRQTICFFYDSVPGIGPANLFGKITNGLDSL